MNRLIDAHALTRRFGKGEGSVDAVRTTSCYVAPGELVLLNGPSGSGKTTLISMLAGLIPPSSGYVDLCGIRVSGLTSEQAAKVRRHSLGFVFQTYSLFRALSAVDNVAEILALKGMARHEAKDRAVEVLQRVGLGERLRHRPGELSGGQRQRVAIARALAGDPPLIIGDEITAALDLNSAQVVMEILAQYVGPRTAVLLVTHDRRLERYAHRILEMEDGAIRRERGGHRALHTLGQERGVFR
jgi:putative ABC transport system ATP-binding protein